MPLYKKIRSELPKVMTTKALFYGYLRYSLVSSVQTLEFNLYNGPGVTQQTSIGSLVTTVFDMPHIAKIRGIYDQYKFTGFSAKFKHVGSTVQDDNINAHLPTPIAVAILLTDSQPSFEEVLVRYGVS